MNVKINIGIVIKPKKKMTNKKMMKKRISMAKQDSVLPFLTMLGALGSLIGRVASAAKTVNSKAVRRQFQELQRRDCAMEQDCGLYLSPYKYGRGLYLSSYKRVQGVSTKKKTSKRR